MAEWWEALGTAGQVFACIAIPATVFLIAQTIMMFIGLGAGQSDGDGDSGDGHDFDHGSDSADVTDGAFDGDADGDGSVDSGDTHDGGHDINDGGLRLFTLRGLIAFFSIMGWTGALCCSGGMETGIATLIAIAAGFAAMLVVALIMKLMISLQSDGTENARDAIGVSGTVYLRIPAKRAGKGKITAIIRGKLSEKSAVTDEPTEIAYGEEVIVTGISGEDTLIVRRKNKI